MPVLETPRLALRELTPADAAFIRELVNEPAWLKHIGDRGIRTEEDAVGYIVKGPVASYARFGFGLWLVERKADGCPLGICGVLQRDTLPDPDLGFAFLARHHGQGYAHESASATLAYAREQVGCRRVLAITSPGNTASIRLLEKLGFRFERLAQLAPPAEVKVFTLELRPA